MTASISMKNLVGFNKDKRLHRYHSSKDIMEEFYLIRLYYYEKRKDYLKSKLFREVELLKNKAKFIIEIVEETIVIRNVKKIKII